MANLAIGDIWEAKVYCQAGDQTALNVYHYRVGESTGLPVGDNVFAAKFESEVAAAYLELLSENAAFIAVGVRRIHPQPPTTDAFSKILGDTGSVLGDVLPRQVSGMITKQTGFGGRSFRGRAYIPFPGSSDSDINGKPSAAYVGRLNALTTKLELPFTVGTAPNTCIVYPVLYHRLDGSWTYISNMIGRPRWGTQRRRGDYGAVNLPPV